MAGFELFQEGRHEKGGEEQDGGPEQDIRGVGSMMTTRRPDKLTVQADTLLQKYTGGKKRGQDFGVSACTHRGERFNDSIQRLGACRGS